ncbi:TPA: restriction endonuclease subunit S [Vibrio metschnikovii]
MYCFSQYRFRCKRAPIVEQDTGIRCLRIQDVSQVKSFEDWGFTDVTPANFKKFQLKKDDILIARTGGSIGVNRYIEEDLQSVYNNGLIRIRVNIERYDPKFVFYLLRTESFKQHINAIAFSTAAQPNMKIRDFLRFEFLDITLEQQKLIARNLTSLDRKIELNKKTNQTLEQMAQAIFKSWFVDFDPVKAKMRGEQPEGMDEATASLFPEKLVESELGLIPEGWEVLPFSEWVKITKGKNITKKTIVDGDVPVVAGGLKPAYFHNAHNVDGPAITISASGANAGYVNLYFENIWASDCSYISQSTTPLFFLQYVALRYNQKKIFDMQTGAAQPHIYPRDFERLMIVVPNKELCRKLEEVFASFFRAVANNKQQNIDLAALRDTLLPKLLSGDIELETK